jgi:outer membrane biosynthesis protein TonB
MLDDLEHDALVKFINVLEIDVEIGEQDDVDIVEDIMKQAKLVVENIGAAVEVAKEDQQEAEAETETEEVKDVEVAPEVEEPKKEKKKKSKKDKKDKKKKKKSKKESKE